MVIGIVAATAVILGTNFVKLIGNVDTYEDEVVAKGIAEAAYIYYESKANTSAASCITGRMLIDSGFISSEQGLLKKYDATEIKKFSAKVEYVTYEKKATVYKNSLDCSDNSKVIEFE
ncbi:MAG: hypothetical protein IJA94_02730 [Bacilli bacterium]|nr:hypothetical protein [Bacilli bacterium]